MLKQIGIGLIVALSIGQVSASTSVTTTLREVWLLRLKDNRCRC